MGWCPTGQQGSRMTAIESHKINHFLLISTFGGIEPRALQSTTRQTDRQTDMHTGRQIDRRRNRYKLSAGSRDA